MNTEQLLLSKWRNLPASKQQEVMNFVAFLEEQIKAGSQSGSTADRVTPTAATSTSNLGKKLLEIREEIVASGLPLLGVEELEKEIAERRGGYRVCSP